MRETPWVDWADYWGAGDLSSQSDFNEANSHLFNRNIRGVDGALLDLEYQRMELIKFNLFDNRTLRNTRPTADRCEKSGRRCGSRRTIRTLPR